MSNHTLQITLEAVVLSQEGGLWCGFCALPSRSECEFVVVETVRLSQIKRGRISVCDECDNKEIT